MSAADRWRAFVESIPEVRAMKHSAQAPLDEEQLNYAALMRQLPDCVTDSLADEEEDDVEKSTPPDSRTAAWCFADMPEGDFPKVYSFPTLEGMLSALARREGTDTAVWPFYGFPFRLTKPILHRDKPACRYLQLDMTTAVRVSPDGEIESVTMDELENLEFETEGWLGDPVLRTGQYFLEPYVDADAAGADDSDASDELIDDEGHES